VVPGSIVLLHSPLLGAAAWGRFPAALADAIAIDRAAVFAVDVPDVGEPTHSAAYVAHAAAQIARAALPQPLVLVGYSGSGALVPQVAYAQRAASRRVGAYVFLDAGLPHAPGALPMSRLELDRVQDPGFAAQLEADLLDGVQFPAWTDADLAAQVPDPADRALLLANMRPQGLAYFAEIVPHPADWPDAPCGYLQTSAAYEKVARAAALRGFVCRTYESGHFAPLVDPDGVAAAVAELLAAL
jgi:hypothetical protein